MEMSETARTFSFTSQNSQPSQYHSMKLAGVSRTRLLRHTLPRLLARALSSAGAQGTSGLGGPLKVYDAKVASGVFTEDLKQRAALQQMQRMFEDLQGYVPPPPPEPPAPVVEEEGSFDFFDWLKEKLPDGNVEKGMVDFRAEGRHTLAKTIVDTSLSAEEEAALFAQYPLGYYLYGGVGCGKTMLMDMLYDECDFVERKRRVHFHGFMLDVHKRMHALRSATEYVFCDAVRVWRAGR